jgi:hypothetical protein
MIQEAFNFYKPCKLLQPYVRYYWVFSSNQMPNTYSFPIGCLTDMNFPLLFPVV